MREIYINSMRLISINCRRNVRKLFRNRGFIMSQPCLAGDGQSQSLILKTMDSIRDAVGIAHPYVDNVKVITTQGLIICVDPDCLSENEKSKEEYNVNDESEIVALREERETNRVSFLVECNETNESKAIHSRSFGKKGSEFGQLQDAVDIKCLTTDKIIVTDLLNNKVQVFSKHGKPTAMYVADEMIEPWGLAVTLEDNVAVVSNKTKNVSVIDQEGNVVSTFSNAGFQCPSGIVVTDAGLFVITDSVANTVSMHDVNGELINYLTNEDFPFKKPRYVTLSPKGEIIVSDSGNHCLEVFDRSGKFVRRIGRFGREEGCFRFPRGVCTDSSGNIFVADHYNNRISVFSETGEFSQHLITSDHGLLHPQGVTISNTQHLYITHGDLKASQIMVFKLRP